jgi:hypothetical protein
MTSFTFSVTCWVSKHEAKPAKPRLAQHKLQFWFFVFQLIFVVLAPWHVLAPISVLRFRHTVQLPGKSSLWSTCCSIISSCCWNQYILFVLSYFMSEWWWMHFIKLYQHLSSGHAFICEVTTVGKSIITQFQHIAENPKEIIQIMAAPWLRGECCGVMTSAIRAAGPWRPLKGTSTDQPCAPSYPRTTLSNRKGIDWLEWYGIVREQTTEGPIG